MRESVILPTHITPLDAEVDLGRARSLGSHESTDDRVDSSTLSGSDRRSGR